MMQATSTNSTIHESLVGVNATVHIRFDDSLGAVLIGLIFASILFGIANVQSLIYYQNPANDPKYMKWTVMVLWLLDAFHLALVSHAIYGYLVTDFGSPTAVTKISWSLCVLVFVTIWSDSTIALFYVYRVWIMSNRSHLLAFAAIVLNLGRFVSGMAFGIKAFAFKSVLEFTEISWLVYINLGLSVASDFWCALCLCYYLAKGRTGIRTSNTTLSTLMLYIISTGLLTSLFSICCLVLAAAVPRSYFSIGIYFCLSELYFNGFLGMLNGRNYLREGISQVGTSRQEAYRLPQIINIGSALSSRHETSFGTVQVIPDKTANSVYNV